MKNDLYDKISAKANYVDPEMAREFYFALIKVIMAEVREKGKIKLPSWGTFEYFEGKPVTMVNVITKMRQTTKIRKKLRFTPCTELKAYINMMK